MTKVVVNHEILIWARESAGLDLAEAAERIGFTATDKISAEEKLQQLESGERFLTRPQLIKLASVYRRPLITFYMKAPPVKSDRGEDFRQTPGALSRRENALLDSLLRDIKARQEMVRSILEDEEVSPPAFANTGKISDGVDKIAQLIATKLDFDYTAKSSRKGDADNLFKTLRTKAEAAGVFVLLIGDLGSHHTALSADVFRGFAIADKLASFVVINDQDARAARSFTLLHELAHIAIGESGISGAPTARTPHDQHDKVERFCNDVAGEFLLSKKVLGAKPDSIDLTDKDAVQAIITHMAREWSVSESMVAYRINRVGWIADTLYETLVAEYTARWRAVKQKTRDEREPDDAGPHPYVVKQSKLGNALVDIVRHSLRENVLTDTKAAQILGIKPTAVEPFLKVYEKIHIGIQGGAV